MYHIYLIVHLLSACIWVGGHLLLSFRYLPAAYKHKDISIIAKFEEKFETIGIPALVFLVLTGILMAIHYGVYPLQWFAFSGKLETTISIKLSVLLAIVLLAIHARFFIIPKLTFKSLNWLTLHVILVTLLSVSMLVLGSFVRFGGI
ncbi:MAG: copper resistance protein CopD [Candidatus Methylacidiphilales bacterium]